MNPRDLAAQGLRIGRLVRIDAKHRHSHHWRGTIDSFEHITPGVIWVRVRFIRIGHDITLTYKPSEVIPE